jgi:hypothetical protein
VPDAVLSQLGLKVQHALRAFTAKDRKSIKQTAENYPLTDFYKTDEVLTSMGIGQALITALNEKGIPTPLAATLLRAPASRMDILEQKEIDAVIKSSQVVKKYDQVIDSKSAYELLTERLEKAGDKDHQKEMKSQRSKASKEVKESSMFEDMSKNTMVRQMGNTLLREVTRGILGMLGVKR